MNDKRNPEEPTATAPDSVEESVYEETDHAGQDGQDAADPPSAAHKSDGDDAGTGGDEPKVGPGSDLDVDEGADAFETHEEAKDAKSQREDVRDDEDIITLDSPD